MTIIANNCIGGSIYRDLKRQYKTPTVDIHIFPQQWCKFCTNLKHYMDVELVEYPVEELSDYHKEIVTSLLGGINTDHPYGLIDDIVIFFHHSDDFKTAKEKWDRRKQRIDYEHIGYMFYVRYPKFKEYAIEFANLNLPNSAIFLQDTDVPCRKNMYRVDVPEGEMFLSQHKGKHNYEQNFDKLAFIKQIERG